MLQVNTLLFRAIKFIDKTTAAFLCVVFANNQDPMEFLAEFAEKLRPYSSTPPRLAHGLCVLDATNRSLTYLCPVAESRRFVL